VGDWEVVVKERPILYSAPMVRATLAGRKTVTRRLDLRWLKAKPGDVLWGRETWAAGKCSDGLAPSELSPSFYQGPNSSNGGLWYPADNSEPAHPVTSRGKTRVSIHMPRWASRIVTPILSVRAEQLVGITEEDAKAEGLTCLTKDGGQTFKYGIPDRDGLPGTDDDGWPWSDWDRNPLVAYAKLWDAINGDRAPWSSNPTVVRIEFKPLEVRR
jgi:hypothetical protein